MVRGIEKGGGVEKGNSKKNDYRFWKNGDWKGYGKDGGNWNE